MEIYVQVMVSSTAAHEMPTSYFLPSSANSKPHGPRLMTSKYIVQAEEEVTDRCDCDILTTLINHLQSNPPPTLWPLPTRLDQKFQKKESATSPTTQSVATPASRHQQATHTKYHQQPQQQNSNLQTNKTHCSFRCAGKSNQDMITTQKPADLHTLPASPNTQSTCMDMHSTQVQV